MAVAVAALSVTGWSTGTSVLTCTNGRRTAIVMLAAPLTTDSYKLQLGAFARALSPTRRDEKPASVETVEPEILELLALLEQNNPTDRPATSPLLDGVWTPLWTKNVAPLWAENLPFARLGRADLSLKFDLSEPGAPGLYRHRMRIRRVLCADVEASCSALGGWDLRTEYRPGVRISVLGVPLFRLGLDPLSSDLDHDLEVTFLDGTMLILRAARVTVPARIYVLQRQRHEFWQPSPREEPRRPSWLPEA
jgi:hypothetical protein